ncbi:hypothetical protein JCM8097_001827 [Rhodosporidiobolus ruineniae]
MPNTLSNFLTSPAKRTNPDSPPSASSSANKQPRLDAPSTPRKGELSGGARGNSSAVKAGVGAVEEMVLDDSDDDDDQDDLIIVEPSTPSATVKATGAAKDSKLKKPDKPAAPLASIFQKRAPPSPAASSSSKSTGSPKVSKGKGKAVVKEEDKEEKPDVKGKMRETVKHEDEDVKPDVKPGSPTKTIAIFDTAAASSSSTAATLGPSAAPSSADATLQKPLDTPLFSFDPVRDISFPSSDPSSPPAIPFSFFTSALLLISSTKSRLTIRLVLTNLLRTVITHNPSALLPILYLLSNRIAPSYEKGTELGVGWQVLSKAIKETSGVTPQRLKQLSNKHGDPGDIAYEASRTVRLLSRPKELTCEGVYGTLRSIAKLKGTGVVAQKTSLVKKLLLSARGEEVRFVVRILVANLRIGAVRLSLLTALARAFCLAAPGAGAVKGEEESEGWAGGGEFWVEGGERERLAEMEEADVAAAKKKAEAGKGGKGKKKAGAAASKAKKDKTPLELEVEARFVRAEGVVRRVYARHPNLDHLLAALLEAGVGGLEERVGVGVGIPVEPMLGSITRSLSEVYSRFGSRPFVSELKADGQRGQIHVYVTDRTEGTRARPDGVEEGAGMVYSGEELEGLEGKRVWVRTFSRHLEDMSDKYPDIVATMAAMVARSASTDTPLRNFVLDAEVVAIDPVTGAFKTFQELSYRSKKDVELGDIKVRVGIFAFDLMLLNDESLLSSPFRRRRDLLRTLFPALRPTDPRLAKFELIPSLDSTDPDQVREFFEECVRMKGEGIMCKLLDEVEVEVDGGEVGGRAGDDVKAEEDDEMDDAQASGSESGSGSGSGSAKSKGKGKAAIKPEEDEDGDEPTTGKKKGKGKRKVLPATYEPDKRADSWCKVKKDYLDDVGDSLDLVPIAAWHGQGRKAGWWSPFLLACYDAESGQFVAVTKILSGFTDAFYKEYKAKYSEDPENPLTSRTCFPEVDGGGLRPDIWFRPSEVWEIRGADFTLSPIYPAARSLLGHERGVSIRFPRFIKLREDKGVENATTAEQLAELYQKQMEVAPAKEGRKEGTRGGADEEDEMEE